MKNEGMKSVPLKYIVSVQKGKLPKKLVENSDGNLPIYLSMEVMRGNYESAKYVEDYDACVMASVGDILVLWDGSNAGEVMLAKSGVISSTVALLTLKREVDKRFIFYQLKTNEQLLRDSSVGMGIPHVNPQELLNFSFFIPSLNYQTAIANYLDKETSQIDRLIEYKQQLIELYEEEKTAIINQAVTKGINPQAQLKDSGIEWLGLIPEHWEIKRLKSSVSKIGSGVTPRGGAEVYQSQGIPLLRSQNIYPDGLRLNDVAYITQEIHDTMHNSKVLTGDVLLNITGASIGRAMYVEEWLGEANVNQHVCIIRPLGTIKTKFLFYILISRIGQTQIEYEQTGSGREGLNFEALKNFYLPIINEQEQQSIVNHIETQCAIVDSKISIARRQIKLYQEYKQALISEVVTGRVKVV